MIDLRYLILITLQKHLINCLILTDFINKALKTFFVILSFFFVFHFSPLSAQDTIKKIIPVEAQSYIGKVVTVVGMIAGLHKTDNIIYLNIDAKYPDNIFTAVIFMDDFDEFKNIDSFLGKKVEITGIVKEYNNKAEIILNTDTQLTVVK
jgi:DNA/RNA endonuclease YhcR with UshA esterase domain